MSPKRGMEISEGYLISSPITKYKVLKQLYSGSHGKVFQCMNLSNNETVATKMFSIPAHIRSAEKEEAILKKMKELHSGKYNIAPLYESFTHKGYHCLVFEHLDIDLHKFMQSSPKLRLEQIRPILKQLATSLEFLESSGIIHSDLTAHKIMIVDHVIQPLKVKIIGFGSACTTPEEQIGEVQPDSFYRFPGILRDAPLDEAIDVWSLGCIIGQLYMGIPLFTAWNEDELLKQMRKTWRPRQHKQFPSGCFWTKFWISRKFMMTLPEIRDLECFLDLLTGMLKMNPSERINPRQILQSQFMTMSHFKGRFQNSSYANRSQDMMDIRQDQSSDGGQGDQVTKTMSPSEDSSSSTAGPAEEGGSAGMREEKSSLLRTYTINKLPSEGPVIPQKKRKRDDPTGDGNPSKKKTNVSFTEELTLTGCITRGRKRRAEEAPVLDESCPLRKKRACRR